MSYTESLGAGGGGRWIGGHRQNRITRGEGGDPWNWNPGRMAYDAISGVTDVLKGAVSFYGQSQQDKALADQARAGQAGAAPASSGFPIIPVVIGGVVLLGAFMLMKKKGATSNPGRRRRRHRRGRR